MGNKKGKEKAHNTIDGGGGDSDSDNEDSHHVKFEQCLTTSTVNFSDYSLCDGNSLTSPNNPKARAYSTRTAASLPTIIIDSGMRGAPVAVLPLVSATSDLVAIP